MREKIERVNIRLVNGQYRVFTEKLDDFTGVIK